MNPLSSLAGAAVLSWTLIGCASSTADYHKTHHRDPAVSGPAMTEPMPMAEKDGNLMEMCKKMMHAITPDERRAMMQAHRQSTPPEHCEQCMEMMLQHMGGHM